MSTKVLQDSFLNCHFHAIYGLKKQLLNNRNLLKFCVIAGNNGYNVTKRWKLF